MEIVNRFLSFEKLMAGGLVKAVYWIGMVAIILFTLYRFVMSFTVFQYSATTALGMLVATPIVGVLSLVFWRVICELYLVLFRISDQLKDIREALVKGPGTFS